MSLVSFAVCADAVANVCSSLIELERLPRYRRSVHSTRYPNTPCCSHAPHTSTTHTSPHSNNYIPCLPPVCVQVQHQSPAALPLPGVDTAGCCALVPGGLCEVVQHEARVLYVAVCCQ